MSPDAPGATVGVVRQLFGAIVALSVAQIVVVLLYLPDPAGEPPPGTVSVASVVRSPQRPGLRAPFPNGNPNGNPNGTERLPVRTTHATVGQSKSIRSDGHNATVGNHGNHNHNNNNNNRNQIQNHHRDENDAFGGPSLADFVAGFLGARSGASDDDPWISQRERLACKLDTSEELLDDWRSRHQRLACSASAHRGGDRGGPRIVDRYVLDRWDTRPTILRYFGAEARSASGPPVPETEGGGPGTLHCVPVAGGEPGTAGTAANAGVDFDADADATTARYVDVNATVVRIVPFDPFNAYERFHAYVNVALVMLMFGIENPQLVLLRGKGDRSVFDAGDRDFWRLFSGLEPVYAWEPGKDAGDNNDGHTVHRFREIIEAPGSSVSMTNAKSTSFDAYQNKTVAGGIKGRAVEHHCSSDLFRGILAWIRSRLAGLPGAAIRGSDNESSDSAVVAIGTRSRADFRSDRPLQTRRILFSSRRPYCCRGGEIYTPDRVIEDETGFLEAVLDALVENKGHGDRDREEEEEEEGYEYEYEYEITSVDFGSLSTAESIRRVVESNVVVGFHGAGLVWSVFLSAGEGAEESPGSDRARDGGGEAWVPSEAKTVGLVEIFGGNRAPTNKHYHNLAMLAGVPYRSTRFWNGLDKTISWNRGRVHEVAKLIESLFDDE